MTTPPTSFGVLLFPGFQALDVFGPLDILNVLSYNHPITLSIIASTLSPVSTLPPPEYVDYPSLFTQSHITSQSIVPTHTVATAPSNIEVLIVPGGYGTRSPLTEELEFIRTRFPSLRYIFSVCTGSVLLARAGVLDGKKATSNKKAWEWVKTQGEGRVEWVHKARWIEDGNCWTTSGITAGIDGFLALIEKDWGRETADGIAAGMELERKRDWREDVWAGFWEEERRKAAEA